MTYKCQLPGDCDYPCACREAEKYCEKCDNTKDCPVCHGDDASCVHCDNGKCPQCAEPSPAVQRAVDYFRKKADEYDRPGRDEGTVFIERLEDGTVHLMVRSPGSDLYSFVNMPWDQWVELRSLDPAPNEPTIAF